MKKEDTGIKPGSGVEPEPEKMELRPAASFGKAAAAKGMREMAARPSMGNRHYDVEKIKEDMKKFNLGPQFASEIGLITLEET